jgi:hypothetical protein
MRDSPPRSYWISSDATTEIISSHGSFRFKSRAQPRTGFNPPILVFHFEITSAAGIETRANRERRSSAGPKRPSFGYTSYVQTTAHQGADALDAREQLTL